MNVTEIDGSMGEGGGQVLRTAVALAAVTKTPVRVTNIRAKRRKPGMAAQHVAAVRAIAELSSAEVKGADVGSRVVEFVPRELRSGRYAIDVGTAGSVTLVLQAALPAAFAVGNVELRIRGGTDVPMAPPADYFRTVFLRWIDRLGGRSEFEILRRGYYPRGGGEVIVRIPEPARWRPLISDPRPEPDRIEGAAHIANLPEDIVARMASAAKKRLASYLSVRIHKEVLDSSRAEGPGGAISLWADAGETILGGNALAERGKRAEIVGDEAAAAILAELHSGATVDVHAADQLLPYLALANEPSSFLVREVTEHMRSMMWLLGSFLGTHIRTVQDGSLHRVTVTPGRQVQG